MSYQFTVRVADCHVVASPGPSGTYVLALQTSNAIDFAMYYPPLDPTTQTGSVTTYDPVCPHLALATRSTCRPLPGQAPLAGAISPSA
jgi:hypothetical protein